jgi:hypothetical protein
MAAEELKWLREYKYWPKIDALSIREQVKLVGGWDKVFPTGLPRWASRIRNYFNETPKKLMRLDDARSEVYMGFAIKFKLEPGCGSRCPTRPDNSAYQNQTMFERIGFNNALTGDVYQDDVGHIWYQMNAGSTIYHWGDEPAIPSLEAAWTSLRGQKHCPVFKLVCPDGTGGSRECIIENPKTRVPTHGPRLAVGPLYEYHVDFVWEGKSEIGEVNQWEDVSRRIVRHPVYQGSYNYSETVEKGACRSRTAGRGAP